MLYLQWRKPLDFGPPPTIQRMCGSKAALDHRAEATPQASAKADTASMSLTLQHLPLDILFQVVAYCDYRSALSLAMASSSLRAATNPAELVPTAEKLDFFLRVERFQQHADKLACFTCFRMLPRDDFARSMQLGRHGKSSGAKHKRTRRFCWTCAAAHRLYADCLPVRKGPFCYYLCHRCGRFSLPSERCGADACRSPVAVGVGVGVGVAVSATSKLQELPGAVQQRILSMLGYRDAIMLAQTSRYFHEAVDPQDCAIRSKFLFVGRIAQRRRRLGGSPRGSLACYGCFTVKDARKVRTRRHRRAVTWRNRRIGANGSPLPPM